MSFDPTPLFGSALEFAFDKATTEGKITIGMLALVSLFSWCQRRNETGGILAV